MSKIQSARNEADEALKQAKNASRRGDLKEAERWSKVAARLANSADKLARAPQEPEEDAEAIRNEIRRRVQRLIEADQENQRWEEELGLHAIETARCLSEGREAPPPLPPMPYSDKALERIAAGTFDPVKAAADLPAGKREDDAQT